MKLLPIAALTVVLGLGGTAALLNAQDKPGDAPETKKPAAKATKGPRIYGNWAKMSSLTPEQKKQIAAIHTAANAEKKKIEDKEEADIMALLSDEQKAEVAKIKEDAGAAKRKGGDAEPTTKPDGM